MFALHKLGWSEFQRLCHTITREILGQTVECFLDSSDGGRDGAFSGTWKAAGADDLTGKFVVQCKFTSKTNYVLKVSDLADEFPKAKRLVDLGLCDSYILMANAGLSGGGAEKIEAQFLSAGVRRFRSFGSTWINQQILENKRLRMLVPRVYGLGDLSQILDERAYVQARAILESMREDLAKVVVTDAYRKAVHAIDKHGFVLLIGEPAAGKTTIASQLAMAAIDHWNVATLKLDDPSRVSEHWNPDEPDQFFWLDDAFGVTQYEASLVRGWNHVLPQVRAMVHKGAKIVMTSRDYIYRRARRDLKESAFPLLRESQVVIDVRELSADEKRRILYNHLKLGRQPRSFLSNIKSYLEDVANHRRFIPETARRLGDPLFTKGLSPTSHSIGSFVEKREQILQDVLQGLDGNCMAALALIYMRNGRLESPVELQGPERQALERLGSDLGGCIDALDALEGSLVQLTNANGSTQWRFRHPTIGDAYATILARSPEHLGIYMQGISPDRLVFQVTCGDVGIENAIVVPSSLFGQVMKKLEELSRMSVRRSSSSANWVTRDAVQRFLSYRCGREFLSLYLESHPDLLDRVAKPGLYLHAVPEVRMAVRLHEVGLLPEEKRLKFVETVSNYAVEGEDVDALDDDYIRGVFSNDEFDTLVKRVRVELLPQLGNLRQVVESDFSYDEPADEHAERLTALLGTLEECFGDDTAAVGIIEREQAEFGVRHGIQTLQTNDLSR